MSTTLIKQAQTARRASTLLGILSDQQRNQVLLSIAEHLRQHTADIINENQKDLEHAQTMVHEGKLSQSSYQRLILTPKKVEQMAQNMESVAKLSDPLGKIQMATMLDDGLELYRVTYPIGVILIIFESRPEVMVQITALTLKSGNAAILKGGTEAKHSNQILYDLIQQVLKRFEYIPEGAVNLVQTREEIAELVQLSEWIDLIIPRGSNSLVQHIQAHSKVPVLAHADGICHVFLDEYAEPQKSISLVIDSKTEYPAVCNAMETLLVHTGFSDAFLASILQKLQEANVELRLCEVTMNRLNLQELKPCVKATTEDWQTEYTDLILSVKTVESLQEAIDHINMYGSKHTDCIVTENAENAEKFMNTVDSSSVFWNASTRFADGFRYGFGAEVGISTSKTHARGPVGLDGLVIYKYKLYGTGQCVATYNKGGKPYRHTTIDTTSSFWKFPSQP
ncbi:MAG: glutamate-5-semialdehyde dehydrogenase [SAR324 cluster bacterium]|nr:glutamate-5-semialdehyde dehydrogenase [SAR324 cluster bacterium]